MANRKPLVLVDGVPGQLSDADKLPLSAVDGAVSTSDARLTDAREWTAETVSQEEAEAGTATTRRAWTAQRVRQAITGWWNGVTSAFGRSFVAAADAAAGRTALGLGTAATRAALGATGALYSRDSVLGTVSQSSGVPTGAIIERGSNANGEYVRFADGTQICYMRRSGVTITTAAAANFSTTYPAAFLQEPHGISVVCGSTADNNNPANQRIMGFSHFDVGQGLSPTTSLNLFLYRMSDATRLSNITETANYKVVAIGRWF